MRHIIRAFGNASSFAFACLLTSSAMAVDDERQFLQFPIDIVVANVDAVGIERAAQLLVEGKPLSISFDATGLKSESMGREVRTHGLLRVRKSDIPGYQIDMPLAIGLDLNANQQIDEGEPRFALGRELPSTSKGFKFAGGQGVVFVQPACACNGYSGICSTKTSYSMSLIDKKTGATLWGSEQILAVMHNDCSFTTVLGKRVAIPDAVANRSHTELALKLATGNCAQIVPLNAPLGGAAGGQGPKGEKGDKGDMGVAGPAGAKGDKGDKGDQGEAGLAGAPGAVGAKGDKGDKGDQGEAGLAGAPGAVGAKGDKGDKGDTGLTGAQGVAGAMGPKGDKGDIGLTGAPGAPGAVGAKGDKGDTGLTGAQGIAGVAGPKGDKGETGLAGPAGAKGEKGDMGPQGLQGPQGSPGDANIRITSQDSQIFFHTPTFEGATFDMPSLNSRFFALNASLDLKANAQHTHVLSEITGQVPACVSGANISICRDGELLVVNGMSYAPVPQYDGKALQTKAVSGLKLGTTAGRWNDIGVFDDTTNSIVAISGAVIVATGTMQTINASEDLKVRVQSGKIQEWHTSPTLVAKPLFFEVKFTKVSTLRRTASR